MNLIKYIFAAIFFTAALSINSFAQSTGSIAGTVTDVNGAVVIGANVSAVGADGKEKTTTSNKNGEFTIGGLQPGTYIFRVAAPNFQLFEIAEVAVAAGKKVEQNVTLTIAAVNETVNVGQPDQVSTDPSQNADATVLKDKDLEALPDDPDDLAAALQALAGPSAGPNGGQIYIDGFTGGNLPPKESIREIRINSNPFSAEFDRLGFGRIEIFTKPGSDKFHGNAFFNFNDESLNSRNPFAVNRAPSQTRFFGGNFSGPIKKGKASYFVDINKRDQDNNAVTNAIVLDSAFNPVAFNREVIVPNRRFSFAPRVDYQINDKNTLVARYEYNNTSSDNVGVGEFSLPSRGYKTSSVGHEFRLTETMIVNPKTVNETRLSYDFNDRKSTATGTEPTVNVSSAFTAGSASVGDSFTKSHNWELSNNTTTAFGKNSQHSVKFGFRVRGVHTDDQSDNNFLGSFSFAGIVGLNGVAFGPLQQYQARAMGTVDPNFLNFIPNQYSVVAGDPLQSVSQVDFGGFFTDDWRLRQGLTLSLGLRYENQTNIHSNLNFAPRVAVAWSPGAGGAKPPKTVFRSGFGIFYDRFSENYTLNAERFNGVNQVNYIVNSLDPIPARRAAALLLLSQPIFNFDGSVTNVPTVAQIQALLPGSSTIRTVASDLNAPYTIQGAFSVERSLPFRTTLSASYIITRSLHTLRTRDINAPFCPSQTVQCSNAVLPDPTSGPIFEYESSGIQNAQQLIVGFRNNLSPKISLFGTYRLGFSKGNADNLSYPAYTYDLSGEYGRLTSDVRNFFNFGGNFTLPWQVSLSPFIIATSGRPFNIISGIDYNADTLLTERPTFAQLGQRCSDLHLSYSWCDVSGFDPNAIIPRNWGEGPPSFTVNLRVSKNFGFGGKNESSVAGNQQGGGNRGGGAGGGNRGGGGGGGNRGGGGFGGPGGPGGGFGGFGGGGGDRRKPYNLNLSINFQNLFNKVNLNAPVGNLASGRFGQSTSTSGGFGGFGGGGGGTANRRIDLSVRFSW
jgi:carboxypeptidase family protein